MTNYKYDSKVIFQKARGKWDRILPALAPQLKPALEACPKHVACPVHGGTDGFRFYPDYAENGNCVCNSCGQFSGINILKKVNNWDYATALKAVAEFLDSTGSHVDSGSIDQTETYTKKGKVTELGLGRLKDGKPCFRICLTTEERDETLWGVDLQRVAEELTLKVGDNAEVTFLGKATVRSPEGKTCKKNLWTGVKLPSDKEIAQAKADKEDHDRRKNTAIAIHWKTSNPFNREAKPMVEYFTSRSLLAPMRGFVPWLADIRYQPNEQYDNKGTKFPCMVCAVRSKEGDIVTLHRTFLTEEGRKIPSEFGPAKKLMAIASDSTINGAGIRIGEVGDDGILCVTEGVETALSVVAGTGYPCVAAITANGMASFELPVSSKPVKAVLIFADKDASGTGQKAAKELQAKLMKEGIPSLIFLPSGDVSGDVKGIDWNDVLQKDGVAAFPVKRETVA